MGCEIASAFQAGVKVTVTLFFFSHLNLLSFLVNPFLSPQFLSCQYNLFLFLYLNLMAAKIRSCMVAQL